MPPTNKGRVIDLNELARRAGFPKGFDLALYTQNALDAFRQVRELELLDRGIRIRRKTLRHLAVDAQAVAHDLESLDPDVLHDLGDRADPDLLPDILVGLPAHLERLSIAAVSLARDLPDTSKGRPAEAGLEFAIREMYAVFHDHFPNEVGFYRKDEAEHGYDGKFYHLVRLLVAELGIEKSASGIGKAIVRSLKGYGH